MKKGYEAGLAERRLKEEEVSRLCPQRVSYFLLKVVRDVVYSGASCPRPCGYGLDVLKELHSSLGIDNKGIE